MNAKTATDTRSQSHCYHLLGFYHRFPKTYAVLNTFLTIVQYIK